MQITRWIGYGCLLPMAALAQAQPAAFPAKAVRLVVGFSPGSTESSPFRKSRKLWPAASIYLPSR